MPARQVPTRYPGYDPKIARDHIKLANLPGEAHTNQTGDSAPLSDLPSKETPPSTPRFVDLPPFFVHRLHMLVVELVAKPLDA